MINVHSVGEKSKIKKAIKAVKAFTEVAKAEAKIKSLKAASKLVIECN